MTLCKDIPWSSWLLSFGASSASSSRGILDTGLGATEIAFWRALLAGGMFLVHGAFTGSLKLLHRRDGVALAGFALVGITLFYTSLIFAIETGGISLAFLLLYNAPALVAILAWLLLGERLTRLKVVLVGLALIGTTLIARNGGTGVTVTFTSVAWGLCSGLSYASYYFFGKWILDRYSPITVYAFALPLGTAGLLPLVDFSPKPTKRCWWPRSSRWWLRPSPWPSLESDSAPWA